MKLPEFLEKQLLDFVVVYKKYYRKTFSVTLLLAIACFVISSVLFGASTFSRELKVEPEIIWSFFYGRYSQGRDYCLGDLIKIVFIFFVAFFALSFYKFKRESNEVNNFYFVKLFKGITATDIVSILGVLLISCGVDYLLVMLENFFSRILTSTHNVWIVHQTVFHVRIYLPLVLFAVICAWRLGNLERLTGRKILFLYISLWLFNEFNYETMVWVRGHCFAIVLLPFYNTDYYFLLENVLSIPITAFYFLGFSSAMAHPFEILEEEPNDSALTLVS